MAKIIDISYFDADLYIAQKTEPSVAALLNSFIDKYEFEYLQQVLGYELAKDFYASLPDAEGIYDALLNGDEFTGLRGLERWSGFKVPLATTGKFKSPIANYVYVKYTNWNSTQSTGAGEKVVESQNAVDASPVMKLYLAWGDMVNANKVLYNFLRANMVTYPKFNPYYLSQDMFKNLNVLGI